MFPSSDSTVLHVTHVECLESANVLRCTWTLIVVLVVSLPFLFSCFAGLFRYVRKIFAVRMNRQKKIRIRNRTLLEVSRFGIDKTSAHPQRTQLRFRLWGCWAGHMRNAHFLCNSLEVNIRIKRLGSSIWNSVCEINGLRHFAASSSWDRSLGPSPLTVKSLRCEPTLDLVLWVNGILQVVDNIWKPKLRSKYRNCCLRCARHAEDW